MTMISGNLTAAEYKAELEEIVADGGEAIADLRACGMNVKADEMQAFVNQALAALARLNAKTEAIRVLADIIEESAREAGPAGVPSGHIYAALMSVGVSLATYQAILGVMQKAGRITLENNVIRGGWDSWKV
jgi:hypothetical protein